jgi:cytochrome c oxidase assembly protein subunit 15
MPASIESTPARPPLLAPITYFGFLTGFVLWFTWFVTHLPWAGVPEKVALPIVLGAWLAALLYAGFRVGPQRALQVCASAGLVAALLGLLFLGSKLTEKTSEQHAEMMAATVKPNAGLMVLGFLATGAVLGVIGGFIGSRFGGSGADANAGSDTYLPRFGVLAVVTTAPLLFVGGLVTSTNSGMAVPDWPNSYGSNMFLYPLGPRAQGAPDMPANKIFLEHSHRLFGTLVGLTSLSLMVWTLRSSHRKVVKVLACVAFGLVVTQGVLGGVRVLRGNVDAEQDNRIYAMLHGVLGQIVFAVQVFVAVKLMGLDVVKNAKNAAGEVVSVIGAKKVRVLATAAFHASIVQLLLGAAFRHFRHTHILWTHIAFALVVALLGLFAGFLAIGIARDEDGKKLEPAETSRNVNALRKVGAWVAGIVGLQFALGWAAFLAGGTDSVEARNAAQAILRTLHQANGAAMLAVIAAMFVIARGLAPKKA